MRKMGDYITLGSTKYFIPNLLPPKDPRLNLDDESLNLYGQAMLYLGKLNELATRIPDIKRFIKAYITKEALLSSEIEGINTTMLDIYTQSISESKPDKSIQLVNNYYKALYKAVDMIQNDFIKHGILIELGHKVRVKFFSSSSTLIFFKKSI